ncbi:lipid A deacylase LpxR family protein [Rariglobus hedericola]|nr:lipid A deacylase LpxR family protein [Rariglobus hedericola]
MKTSAFVLLAALSALVARAAAPDETVTVPVTHEPLRFGSFTLYTENDKYFAGTDEHYTNGLKFSVLSTDLRSFTDDSVPKPIRGLSRLLGGLITDDLPYKLGLSFGQNIYTPEDTQIATYQPNDRPYAAWLYLGVAFQVYHPPAEVGGRARLDVFEVTGGMVGPSALGPEFQNNFHNLIGVETANGWDNQIHDEPGLNLVYERKYRWSTADARSGWGADFIPHAGLSLGNVFTYANAGFEVRAGYALPADFGSNLIRPSGDSNSLRRPPFNIFVFAASDGRAVARDITLDGNSFRDSASVDKKNFVADLYAGLGIGTTRWQFTYAQAYRTIEFRGQDDRSVFGSISVAFFY